MPDTSRPEIAAACERLRGYAGSAVALSSSDLIVVDSDRDFLLDELASVADHALAVCCAAYHPSLVAVVAAQRSRNRTVNSCNRFGPEAVALSLIEWALNKRDSMLSALAGGGPVSQTMPRAHIFSRSASGTHSTRSKPIRISPAYSATNSARRFPLAWAKRLTASTATSRTRCPAKTRTTCNGHAAQGRTTIKEA